MSRWWRARTVRTKRRAWHCGVEKIAKAGISSQDLEAAAEGNLIGNMLQALDGAEFRQMYRRKVVAITQGDSAGREAGSNARQPGHTARSRCDFP